MDARRRQLRRKQGWILVAYSLGVLAMNGMEGVWRHVTMSISAMVLLVVVAMMLRARWSGECGSGVSGESTDL